ncbi:MAG: biliverdin-producing heme oxygenase [Actinobacteria bacterium]|nr:biliverdin-producing heme oxygenase [Actinomycetota bacterium]
MSAAQTDATFSAILRERTADDHRDAETSTFMSALVDGHLPLAGYTDMLAQHAYAYEALESPAPTVADDPVLQPFLHPGLLRADALAADLHALVGPEWRTVHRPTPATERYVSRLREVGSSWTGGYVAHHYTRYLGDLSGGQFIGRIAARTYDLTPERGGRFASFDQLGDLTAFKDAYRAALDAAPWDGDEQVRIVDEIRAAYALNGDVFAGLEHHTA